MRHTVSAGPLLPRYRLVVLRQPLADELVPQVEAGEPGRRAARGAPGQLGGARQRQPAEPAAVVARRRGQRPAEQARLVAQRAEVPLHPLDLLDREARSLQQVAQAELRVAEEVVGLL